MGVARIFQRGGGGHTDSYRGYSSDCHLNIVSCLLTRRLTKGGGARAPQDPPPLATPMAINPKVLHHFEFWVFKEIFAKRGVRQQKRQKLGSHVTKLSWKRQRNVLWSSMWQKPGSHVANCCDWHIFRILIVLRCRTLKFSISVFSVPVINAARTRDTQCASHCQDYGCGPLLGPQ